MSIRLVNFVFNLILICYTVCLLSIQAESTIPRSLHVGLHASWPSTSSTAEALSWIVHTTSNEQALPFLKTFSNKHTALPKNQSLSEAVEHHIILESVQQLFPSSLLTSTLNWVLHSRQYSPRVHLHYSIARDTLSSFSSITSPPIFAVRTNPAQTTAVLILHPHQLAECPDCPNINSPTSHPLPFLHPLTDDILLNPNCPTPTTTILYADLASADLALWLPPLTHILNPCHQSVAFRFWQLKPPTYSPSLQGFTLQATLKSTEYKVVDDRIFQTRLFADCGYGEPVCKGKNTSHLTYLWPDTVHEKTTFSGIQALQYLHHKADGDFEKALQHLRLFTEDGPSVTRSKDFIAPQYVDDSFARQLSQSIRSFRKEIGEQDLFFINGHAFDVYSLTQGTEKLMSCLSAISSSTMQLNVTAGEFGQTIHGWTSIRKEAHQKKNALRVGLNFHQHVPNALIWFNDMHNDLRYKQWPTLALNSEDDMSSFVLDVNKQSHRKTANGMEHTRLVKVKSNHLSLLLIVDPGDDQQFGYLNIPESVIRADLPIQVGIVIVPNGPKSSMIAAAFHYFLRIKGRKTAVQFFSMIRQIMQYMGGGFQQVTMTEQLIELAFQQIAMQHADGYQSAAEVLEKDIEIRKTLEEAENFAQNLGLFKNTTVELSGKDSESPRKLSLICLLNGVVVKDVAADVIPIAIAEQQRIASLLKSKDFQEVKKGTSSFDQWVTADSDLVVVNRFSQEMRTEQVLSGYKEQNDGLSTIKASLVFALRNEVRNLSYLDGEDKEQSKDDFLVTVWLAAGDHTAKDFRRLKSEFLELTSSAFASRTKSRLAIVPPDSPISSAVLSCSSLKNCRTEPTYFINGKRILASSLTATDDLIAEIAFAYESQSVSDQITGDLRLLYQLHSSEVESKCAKPNEAIAGDSGISFSSLSNAIVKLNVSNVTYVSGTLTGANDVKQPISVAVVVDPMRRDSYVTGALIEALRRAYSEENLFIQLVFAPSSSSLKKKFDQPVTYHKFLLESESTFRGDDSRRRRPPRLTFFRLPQQNVLTATLDPPRAWFVSSYATNYDMDNIILDSIGLESRELHSEYELRNLIVEGSCIDEAESPPQGLQLILEDDSGVTVDTLVMANLGYFQLKVPTPGQWKARLAPGPSSDIFAMKRMEMYKDGSRTVYHADSLGRVPIPVDSLSGAGGILLRVERNPGMNGHSVLAPDKVVEKGSKAKNFVGRMWSTTLNRMYGEGKSTEQGTPNRSELTGPWSETIHVFSVASGHLYERFLKIMISSVTRHASRPVKFWLLENYLSPSFKKVLPLFAKKYGADIGMVTYRWPGWLRAQTEKQRIIWAYKILFLDVLFPLNVGRIIFVDSDQVIRGDLAELMDIDLHGAPYGYVPFCDSRKEVEGYRFWKTGFWKETLRGAKYRISALYVVDLDRFRQTAAGDTLRFIYQTLSADPNSLSNLDQDLPNYASVASGGDRIVPIFDLPQEWLWCESWCDDESKKKAKAIDLCNNPMTKEPKLISAKRIITEWVEYDEAASKLTEELYRVLLGEEATRQSSSDVSIESVGAEGKDEL